MVGTNMIQWRTLSEQYRTEDHPVPLGSSCCLVIFDGEIRLQNGEVKHAPHLMSHGSEEHWSWLGDCALWIQLDESFPFPLWSVPLNAFHLQVLEDWDDEDASYNLLSLQYLSHRLSRELEEASSEADLVEAFGAPNDGASATFISGPEAESHDNSSLETRGRSSLEVDTRAQHRGSSSSQPKGSKEEELVGRVLAYFKVHMSERITLKEVAQHCGVSTVSLHAAFKKCGSGTAMEHLMELRMQWAKRAVEESEQPFQQIAAECGFADAASFSRAYKKHFGRSPSEARKQIQWLC